VEVARELHEPCGAVDIAPPQLCSSLHSHRAVPRRESLCVRGYREALFPTTGRRFLSERGYRNSACSRDDVKDLELLGSMGTVGHCLDNAPMESCWGSIQIELLNRKQWMTNVELVSTMADYIVNFYNPSPATRLTRVTHSRRV
jgi:hypothetical protein